jgi:hypothetical protein
MEPVIGRAFARPVGFIRTTKGRVSPRASWIPSAAAIRAGDDFKEVTVEILEVDSASAVVVIDLAFLLSRRISPRRRACETGDRETGAKAAARGSADPSTGAPGSGRRPIAFGSDLQK